MLARNREIVVERGVADAQAIPHQGRPDVGEQPQVSISGYLASGHPSVQHLAYGCLALVEDGGPEGLGQLGVASALHPGPVGVVAALDVIKCRARNCCSVSVALSRGRRCRVGGLCRRPQSPEDVDDDPPAIPSGEVVVLHAVPIEDLHAGGILEAIQNSDLAGYRPLRHAPLVLPRQLHEA